MIGANGQMRRFQHGLVVGKFAPPTLGHLALIDLALAEAIRVTILVYANPDIPGMPQAERAGWLRALRPAADVREPTGAPPDAADDDTHRVFARDWLAARGLRPDAVFTCEDYGDGFAAVLGAEHRRFGVERYGVTDNGVVVPVSASLVRSDPARWAALMPGLVREALPGADAACSSRSMPR